MNKWTKKALENNYQIKNTEKEIIIQWRWPYEIDDTQDIVDTNDGKELNNYKFRIKVYGEEAIK